MTKGNWSNQTFNEGGVMITGSSAHCEPGRSVAELSQWIAHAMVRVSTVERIQAAGGSVIPTQRSAAQPYHVTITGLTPEQFHAVFDPPIPNPSP
jgi:hypothetical protein